jgi:hypothetical protein
MPLLCAPGRPCDAHKDGAACPTDRCPYYCDQEGCDQEGTMEVGPDGAAYCRWHAAQALICGAG